MVSWLLSFVMFPHFCLAFGRFRCIQTGSLGCSPAVYFLYSFGFKKMKVHAHELNSTERAPVSYFIS